MITKKMLTSLLLTLLCTLCAAAQTEVSGKAVGPRAGYLSTNHAMMAAIAVDYNCAPHLRLSPAIGIVFRNEDRDALRLKLDVQAPFFSDKRIFGVYPLAGLNLSSWSLRNVPDLDGIEAVTRHHTRVGLDVGGGCEAYVGSTFKVYLQARYTFMKDYPGTELCAGIAYVFN